MFDARQALHRSIVSVPVAATQHLCSSSYAVIGGDWTHLDGLHPSCFLAIRQRPPFFPRQQLAALLFLSLIPFLRMREVSGSKDGEDD